MPAAPAFAAPAGCVRRRLLCSAAALWVANACQAQTLAPPPGQANWLAISHHELDQLRGGFAAGPGVMVSFGISRAVSFNGQVVTSTSWIINDMGRLTPAPVQALGPQAAVQAQVLQNGPGNTVSAGANAAPLAIYLQNTLNNQAIRSETVINAASNGLSLVKNLNLQATLNEAISNAVGSR